MKKSLSRHTNYALNLTPHYKRKFDLGGSADNITTAYIGDNSTKSVLNNLGGGTNPTGIVAGVEGMLESGLQNAKVASTYNIQSNIADNFGQALSNQNLNTNDQLMEAWDQYSPMQHIHKKDVRGGSTLGRLYNTGMSTIKGAEAGWNAGGEYGAILGAVVGLGTGVGGWLAGDRSAHKLRDRLNKEIDIANQFGYENLANQQSNVEQKNLLRAEGNYVAYGGPLDKRLAGHQMQQIYGNGIPSANRFSKGGNAFIALGDQQTQTTPMEEAQKEKSLIDTLMPYIMRAKEQREARERAEAEQRYRAEYEARAEAQRQAQAEALAQAYGEAAVDEAAIAETAAPEYSNKALLDSIKRFESFSTRPVWDVTGYAIGYGDHNKKINDYYLAHPNENYSEEEASKLIEQTVADTRKILAKNIPNWNELSYAQQDALTSYGYNIRGGAWGIINNSPSLMKALANKDWNGVVRNLNRGWNQRNEQGQLLRGLRKRRNFERLPFLYPQMTTYGTLPDGTVVNPDDLLNVDLSQPYSFENGVWKNTSGFVGDSNGSVPVFVLQKAYGGNLFAFGTEDPYAAAGRRYKNARTALVNNGYSEGDATRLARILATQAVLESGYRDNSDNNYGGHLDPRSRKRMHYNNEEDFWKAQIDTLSKKWPEWNKAQTLSDYYNTINHTDLGLDTLEKFNAYNKAHRGNEVYLYAPKWENKGYLDKLNSIYPRASKYYKEELVAPQFIRAQEPVDKEIPSWDNLHFGFGGNLYFPGGKIDDPPQGVEALKDEELTNIVKDIESYYKSYGQSEGFNRISNNQDKYIQNYFDSRFPQLSGMIKKKVVPLLAKDRKELQHDLTTAKPVSVYKSLQDNAQFADGRIYINKDYFQNGNIDDYEFPLNFVLGHEKAHQFNSNWENRQPLFGGKPNSNLQMFGLFNQQKVKQNGHDEKFSEQHADLEALRYYLFKEGIYDSRGTKNATPQDIKKLREKYPALRPLQQHDDNELATMLNVIAMNNTGNTTSNMAAFGGNLFENGGPTKKFNDPIKEAAFRRWYSKYAAMTGNDKNPDAKEHYYDYRSYWNDNVLNNEDWEFVNYDHLPDTYKLPGHPEMSVESKYQPADERGMVWDRTKVPEKYKEYRRPETNEEFDIRRYKNAYKNYRNTQKEIDNVNFNILPLSDPKWNLLDANVSASILMDSLGPIITNRTLKNYKGVLSKDAYDRLKLLGESSTAIYPDRNAEEAKEYFKSYADSPGIDRIMKDGIYSYPETHWDVREWSIPDNYFGKDLYKEALKNTNTLALRAEGEETTDTNYYTRKEDYLITSPVEDEIDGYEYPDNFVLGHELGHRTDEFDLHSIPALRLNTGAKQNYHDEHYNEKYADIMGLRYLLYKEGIYDSRSKHRITVDQVKELRRRYPKLRPLQQMDDELVAKMLNLVAQNNSYTGSKQVNTAAYGGKLKK